jgi:hypothetical protein
MVASRWKKRTFSARATAIETQSEELPFADSDKALGKLQHSDGQVVLERVGAVEKQLAAVEARLQAQISGMKTQIDGVQSSLGSKIDAVLAAITVGTIGNIQGSNDLPAGSNLQTLLPSLQSSGGGN